MATIVGTLSHEYGHAAVAKYFGYEVSVSYGYMTWHNIEVSSFMESTYLEYCDEIEAGLDFPKKEKFQSVMKETSENGFWITLGGPIQTMLVGTIGFFLLIFNRKKFRKSDTLSISQWIMVFLALFWLRQPTNLFTAFLQYVIHDRFLLGGDEIVLALHLEWAVWSIITFTAMIGAAVLIVVVFYIVPSIKRITFLLAGLCGGIVGYLLWLKWIGPLVLP